MRDQIMCPQRDGFPAKILARTEVGVSYRCAQHGTCGLRYDSMTHEDALMLKVPYDTFKGAQVKPGDETKLKCPRCRKILDVIGEGRFACRPCDWHHNTGADK